ITLPLPPFFCTDPATPSLYTLSLHDALPIFRIGNRHSHPGESRRDGVPTEVARTVVSDRRFRTFRRGQDRPVPRPRFARLLDPPLDFRDHARTASRREGRRELLLHGPEALRGGDRSGTDGGVGRSARPPLRNASFLPRIGTGSGAERGTQHRRAGRTADPARI